MDCRRRPYERISEEYERAGQRPRGPNLSTLEAGGREFEDGLAAAKRKRKRESERRRAKGENREPPSVARMGTAKKTGTRGRAAGPALRPLRSHLSCPSRPVILSGAYLLIRSRRSRSNEVSPHVCKHVRTQLILVVRFQYSIRVIISQLTVIRFSHRSLTSPKPPGWP